MPPPTTKGTAASTPEQALSKLLSFEQLTELAVLVSDITESMRKQIDASFDTSTVSSLNERSHERISKNARNPNVEERRGSVHEETDEEARARRLQARRERNLPERGLQDLKSDALEYFQTWRDGIVTKIVDALNSKDGEEGEAQDGTTSSPDGEAVPDLKVLGSQINIEHSDAALVELYPPMTTSLSSLPWKNRITILSAMLMLVLSQGHYAAYSRVLLLHVVSSLRLPLHVLVEDEIKLAQGLLEAAKRMSADEEAKKRSEENQTARRWKVGLAGVAGAVLIGVTGGLAAPLVAGAIGSVMGGIGLGGTVAAGLLGTLSSSGVIVGSLFGAYGYGMTSKIMDQYAKEIEDFAFIPLRRSRNRGQGLRDIPAEERRLRVTIGISGWLLEKRDVLKPWRVIGQQNEVFALKWELEALMGMGSSLETMATSAVWAVASREIIKRTLFASLMFAMWPITVLKMSQVVDNPFNVAKSRADKAGLVLADAVINKAQGERPVTLIGYSVGARLIYSCLMSLAERRAFGLVESVVLIGAPAPSDSSVWRAIRSVVAGRLVNVYSEKDMILAFLYRTSSIQFGVAGLEEIQGVKGVENVDVSHMVSGHMRYPLLIGNILEHIGWEDINVQEVEREKTIVKMMDTEEAQHKTHAVAESKAEDRTPGVFDLKMGITNERRPALPVRQQRDAPDELGGIFMHHNEQHVIPMLHEQLTAEAEEDLISFDEEPEAEAKKIETSKMYNFPILGSGSISSERQFDQMPTFSPKAKKPTATKRQQPQMPDLLSGGSNSPTREELQSQIPDFSIQGHVSKAPERAQYPMPDLPLRGRNDAITAERQHQMPDFSAKGKHTFMMEKQQHLIFEQKRQDHHEIQAYDSDEEQGIIMIDEEEQGITMLEPEPIPDDDEPQLTTAMYTTKPDADTKRMEEANQARMQLAWDSLELGKR